MAIDTPPRPLPFRMLNGAYRGARRVGAHPLLLRKYALMDRASRRTGHVVGAADP